MENEKTLAEQEVEVLGLMDLALNSKRRWAAIERLIGHYTARLNEVRAARAAQEAESVAKCPSSEAGKADLRKRASFEKVEDAVTFLELECGLRLVQVQRSPGLWWAICPKAEFTAAFDEIDILELADWQVGCRLGEQDGLYLKGPLTNSLRKALVSGGAALYGRRVRR